MQLLPLRLTLAQMQNQWASIINPLLSNPAGNVSLLKSISLVSGSNTVNHLLGRELQGWYITRMRNAAAQIYDVQNTNPTPTLTLILHSSAPVVVDIAVF
jgi:hypothetical protein